MEEAHHRRYAKLRDKILNVKPYPDLEAETIMKNIVDKASHYLLV